VGVAILMSDAISKETFPSFPIATDGDRGKHVMVSRLCKHYINKIVKYKTNLKLKFGALKTIWFQTLSTV